MAVIQDLPAELIYKILELMVQDQDTYGTRCEVRVSLTSTALVTQSWRAPSQELLSTSLHCSNRAGTWRRYLRELSASSATRFSSVKRLELEVWGSDSVNAELAHLQQHQVDLQELRIHYDILSLPPARVYYLAGIRRLELCSPLETEETFRLPAPTMLDTLRVATRVPIPSFLLPLSIVAPRLTNLEIVCSSRLPFINFDEPFKDLAPQLTHLTVHFPYERTLEHRQQVLSALKGFLPVCTSLSTFCLYGATSSDLHYILSLLPNPLTLLETFEIFGMDQKGERLPKPLAEAFHLPCLARLKRWRLTRTHKVRHTLVVGGMYGVAGKEWRAACGARGIEPRSDKRYFTD